MKPKFTFKVWLFILSGIFVNATLTAQWGYPNKPSGNTLTSLSYINDANIWAVGAGSTILHYNGSSWEKQQLNLLTNSGLNSIYAVNENFVWACGENGYALKYDGTSWEYSSIANNFTGRSLNFLNDHQGWAVGDGSNIYYYNGTSWVAQVLPYYSYLNSVYFTDDQHGWAVGYAYTGSAYEALIYKFDGSSWTVEKQSDIGQLYDVYMLDASTGWAVGDKNTIYKYNGSTWDAEPSGDSNIYNSIRAVEFKDANNGRAISNYGIVFKYNGTDWAVDTTLNKTLYDFKIADSGDGWAIGEQGNIFRKQNNTWSSIFSTYNDLRKVRVVDEDNQWLIQGSKMLKYNQGQWDENFNTNSNPITDAFFLDKNNGWALSYWAFYRYDGNTWQQHIWDMNGEWNYMYSIYFTDTATGWAVGSNGKILKYANGNWQNQKSYTNANLQSVYFLNSNEGWAVGDSGVVLKYSNNVWTKMNSNSTHNLRSVYFTDSNHGWAVGSGSSILKYQDGKWVTYSSGNYEYTTNQEIYFKDGTGWIVGDQNTLLKFDGKDWIKQTSFPDWNYFTSIAFVDSAHGWLVSYNNLLETFNAGTPTVTHVGSISVIGSQTSSIWDADTVKVIGSVSVNGDLDIRPNVFVEFEGNYVVNVSGAFRAIGKENAPIKFDVNDTILTGTNCGWQSVSTNNYGTDTSKVKYCNFYHSNSSTLVFYNGYVDIANNNFSQAYSGISLSSVKGGKIVSNTIEDAQYYGIQCSSSKNLAFGGNQIQHNQYGITFNNSSGITLDSNLIAFNTYLGIDFQKTDYTLRNSKICNNEAGAIYMSDSKGNIINCLIANNDLYSVWDAGQYYSGALYMVNSQINMLNSVLANNAETNTYAMKGGGMFFKFTNGNIYNSVIWGNKEYDVDLTSLQPSQVYIYNNGSKPNFYNCVINGGVAGFKKNASVNYTGISQKILDNTPSFIAATTEIGFGTDPEFDAVAANWQVDNSSICINGGTLNIGNMKFPDFDLGDNKRILNGVVDIGAYESRILPIDAVCDTIKDTIEWASDTVRIKGCNLVIESEMILKIRPGTLVEFWGPYKVIVKGAIQAIGTESEPVRFTLHDTTGFATNNTIGWQGFEFDNSNGDMDNSDSSVFKHCVFEYAKDTSSYYYSGIGMFGLVKAKFFSKLTIQNSWFKNNLINLTEYWYNSGLVNLQYSNNVKILNNRFTNNKAAVFSFESSNTLVSNNIISFNNPQGQYKNVISINSSDCLFENNFVTNNLPGNYAAVVNSNSSNMKFVNNVFANNLDTLSSNYQYTIMGYGGTLLMANNTVVNNFGNSMYFYNGPFKSVNNIFWGNRYESSTYYAQEGGLITNCIIQNFWYGSDQIKNIISEDPKFIAPTTGSGYAFDASEANFGLSYFSPAINAGSADTTGILIKTYDIAGKARLNGEKIDIGAYEHQGAKVQYVKQPIGGSYCAADSVVLEVNVNNTATFQWQQDGQDIPGETSTQLVLRDLKESSSGNYICIANNAYGKTYSNPAFIQVKTKPEILAQPVNQEVDMSSPLSVEVMINGTKPITFDWKKNGNSIYDAKTNVLNLSSFFNYDEGRYFLQATNSCGTVVTDTFNLVIKPTAKVNGTDTLYCEGEYINIEAKMGNNNSIKWNKNGIPITTPYYSMLELVNISKSDEGNYSFTVTNNYGTYTSNTVYLSINQRPEIISQPVSRWVENNSAFTSEVSAIGAKPLTYQWYFGDSLIEGETNPRFILAGFGSNNEGSYKCQIQNVCGTLNTDLASYYIAPSVSLSGTGLICENDTINLSVPDDGLTSFQWYKDGFPISGKIGSTLSLQDVSTNDQGNYSCLITKAFGSMQTTPRFISVQSPPETMLQPISQWINPGATASADMSVIGSKPIDYQWFINGDSALLSETTAKIIFASFGAGNQGEYYCIAHNNCGSVTSNKVSFMLKPKIQVTSNRVNGAYCSGDALGLSVTVPFSASFQWYLDGAPISNEIGSELNIGSLNESNSGNYSCAVITAFGNITTESVSLIPRTAPQLLTEPSETWVNESAQAIISVSAMGSKPIAYEWFKADVRVDSTVIGKLQVNNVLTDNEGLYYCKVSNACGTVDSKTVGLYILPKLCLVTADPESGKNLVVWERKANRNIKGYNVYRESVVRDLYEKIGFVSYSVPGVFEDAGSTPELHQNLYKISVVGANDAVSPMSNYHKTLFLQYVSSQGGVNLMWQPYEIEGGAIEFDSYILSKGTDPNNLVDFATISSSLQVYTDTAKASLTELTYYRVRGVLKNICNSQSLLKAGGGPFVDAVSNMEDNRLRSTDVAGSTANNSSLALNLYPQPASAILSVDYMLKKSGPVTFEIVNMLGAQIATIHAGNGNTSLNSYKIDISRYNLQNGIYYLKLKANNEIVVKQFMIQK